MRAVLVSDPCTLLDSVTHETCDRFMALACDYDGAGGKQTRTSRCEACLSLTLERLGVLEGEVDRPLVGDVRDGHDQVWDIKRPHSRQAIEAGAAADAALRGDPEPATVGYRGEYNYEDLRLKVVSEHAKKEGVVMDLRRLTHDQAVELRDGLLADVAIDNALLKFYPLDLDPYEGAQDA